MVYAHDHARKYRYCWVKIYSENSENTYILDDIFKSSRSDHLNEQVGAPYWLLEYGRKDGTISILEEANAIPSGRESMTDLILFFQSMGLSPVDLVSLQGSLRHHFKFMSHFNQLS